MICDLYHFVGSKFVWCTFTLYEVIAFVFGIIANKFSQTPNCVGQICNYDMMQNVVAVGLIIDMIGMINALYFTVHAFNRELRKYNFVLVFALLLIVCQCTLHIISLNIYATITPSCEMCIVKSSHLFDFIVFRAIMAIFWGIILFVVMTYKLFKHVYDKCYKETTNDQFVKITNV